MITVQLENIINELELISDEGNSFMHKTTGRLFHISDKELEYAEKGLAANHDILHNWQNENIQIAGEIIKTDNFIQLPTKDEINEYGMMAKFCLSFPGIKIPVEIPESVSGNNTVYWELMEIIRKNNIGEYWYNFKREAFNRMAIEWCTINSIDFL